MFYVALALVFVGPVCVMAWHYVRLERQLRAEDKLCVGGLEFVGNATFAALTDLADDQPFGIKAPAMDGFRSEPL
jgi:hypothetical protein